MSSSFSNDEERAVPSRGVISAKDPPRFSWLWSFPSCMNPNPHDLIHSSFSAKHDTLDVFLSRNNFLFLVKLRIKSQIRKIAEWCFLNAFYILSRQESVHKSCMN
ncbi:hypothetical protein AA313_de0201072 [Arthrobotrys entomopaga]|nr:hypothetical protein AA313_de0201072 [Arthrobotrys entomopaga]